MLFSRKNFLLWPLFSALLFALAMSYPQMLWPCMLFFLLPIFHAWAAPQTIPLTKKVLLFRFSQIFVLGCVSFFFSTLWFASAYPLNWLKISDPVLSTLIIGSIWLSFILMLSLPLGLWGVFISFLQTKNIFSNAIIGAATWAALEYLRSWTVAIGLYGTETLFGPHHTYYAAAYVLYNAPFLKELLPIGGITLGSFVIILINYSLYYIIKSTREPEQRKNLIFLICFVIGLIFISVAVMNSIRASNTHREPVTISVVNSYFPSSTNKAMLEAKNQQAYDFINQLSQESKLVILPENFDVMTGYVAHPLTATNNSIVVSSFSGQHFYDMYFFNPRNGRTEYYRKQLLMPIGEYSISWVRKLIQWTGNATWLALYDAPIYSAKSVGSHLFAVPESAGTFIGGSLCSENISPYLYRDMTRLGATFLINIASHSLFHGSKLLSRQTVAINVTRALENGRYFATASNYDKSFIVDDTGNIKSLSSESRERLSVINTTIETLDYTTPYVRYGDYVSYISLMIISVALIWHKDPHI